MLFQIRRSQAGMPQEPRRIVAHLDLDSFFVSVEILNNPSLKGLPVIVGGSDRGVVAACSYAARRFGVHSGMSSAMARRLCPQAVVIGGRRNDYGRYSRWVTDIVAARAPLFEKASIDEFYIELTGMDRFFDPLEWTIRLRETIMSETGLPISFGLSCNKMMAKMATNEAKPNGFLHIPPGREMEFLKPLAVGKIPGVGESAQSQLTAMGIHTIGDVQQRSAEELSELLGKWGETLWQKSRGIDYGTVSGEHEPKSVSSEHTFDRNITEPDQLHAELVRLTEKVGFALRDEKKLAACVAVKIRYPDFETTTRQTRIFPSDADGAFIPVVKALFARSYETPRPVRLLGVRLSEFSAPVEQGNLFDPVEKRKELYAAIDEVKKRFGRVKIKRASSG